METITFTQSEIEYIAESFFLYGFAGMVAALLFVDGLALFFRNSVRLIKSRFTAPQG